MKQTYSPNGRHYRTRGFPDYYTVLAVAENATFREIEAAYWKKAFRADSVERNLLNEAYEVLGDEQKRRTYDAERRLNGP